MVESKKPPRHGQRHRGSTARGERTSDVSKGVDPQARLATFETGLAKATGDIAALRANVDAILAELADLRARVAGGLARLRKLPPPLTDSTHEIISVDDREVTLESIRPKRPR